MSSRGSRCWSTRAPRAPASRARGAMAEAAIRLSAAVPSSAEASISAPCVGAAPYLHVGVVFLLLSISAENRVRRRPSTPTPTPARRAAATASWRALPSDHQRRRVLGVRRRRRRCARAASCAAPRWPRSTRIISGARPAVLGGVAAAPARRTSAPSTCADSSGAARIAASTLPSRSEACALHERRPPPPDGQHRSTRGGERRRAHVVAGEPRARGGETDGKSARAMAAIDSGVAAAERANVDVGMKSTFRGFSGRRQRDAAYAHVADAARQISGVTPFGPKPSAGEARKLAAAPRHASAATAPRCREPERDVRRDLRFGLDVALRGRRRRHVALAEAALEHEVEGRDLLEVVDVPSVRRAPAAARRAWRNQYAEAALSTPRQRGVGTFRRR